MKDKASALIDIIDDAQRDRNTLTSYLRLNRACRALGLTNGETERVLDRLEYHHEGRPRDFLQRQLDEREAKRKAGGSPNDHQA